MEFRQSGNNKSEIGLSVDNKIYKRIFKNLGTYDILAPMAGYIFSVFSITQKDILGF